MTVRAFLAVVFTVAACTVAIGCGAEDDLNTSPGAEVDVPNQNPALVAPGTPGAALRRLWTLIEKGAAPAAVDAYLPRLRRRTGVSTLAGGLADAAFRLRGFRPPVVVERSETSRGTLLTVVAKSRQDDADGFRGVFLFQRIGGRWLVAYDTLLASSITGYVTNFVQAGVNPRAKPGPKAASAGLRAADDFRTALFEADELRPVSR